VTSTYDQLNGWGPDYDYWLALTARLAPQAITDLGCGTGQLTVLLAQHATTTVGVDPDPAMLAVARTRPDHELVQWMDGYADAISTASTDLITMTSHVAQVFLTDTDWTRTLGHAHRALRPGGRLAFDTRNPTARGWQAWNPTDSHRSITTPAGPAAVWHEVTDVRDGLVTFATTTRWPAAGREETVSDTLRFRDQDVVRASLAEAGFTVEALNGDWDASPVTSAAPELIVTAHRTS